MAQCNNCNEPLEDGEQYFTNDSPFERVLCQYCIDDMRPAEILEFCGFKLANAEETINVC